MENKRVPEIRIDGFSEEWEHRELGEISEKITEKNKDNIYSETLTNSAEFGIITQRDFFEKDISNKKNLDGYYVVHPDYFVYNPRISSFAPVGPIKRNKLGRTGIMSPLYYVFRTHDVDKTYLEYYFSGNRWHRFMKLNGDTGARSDRFAIKDSVFRQMPIPMPSTEEQVEIGNFFTELEETISICQQELETLKQIKQGFLQKLFPKKGESVPEIRFQGFTGDWEQSMLGEVVDIKGRIGFRGYTRADIVDKDSGVLTYSPTNIDNNQLKISENNTYITQEKFHESPEIMVNNGDILFVKTGSSLGKSALVRGLSEEATINPQIVLLKQKKSNQEFISNYLLTDQIQRLVATARIGGAIPTLTETEISKFKLLIPCLEEQEKIGQVFKQLDDTIALHDQELEILKQTKKAFLQKMFV